MQEHSTTPPTESRTRREIREAAEKAAHEAEKQPRKSTLKLYGSVVLTSMAIGIPSGVALAKKTEHDDWMHQLKERAAVSTEIQQEIASTMDKVRPDPTMDKYRDLPDIEASYQLRSDVAQEYGLNLIDMRKINHDITLADSVTDLKVAAEKLTAETGINVTILSGKPNESYVYPGDVNIAPLVDTASDSDLYYYKANLINVVDAMSTIPKESLAETTEQFSSLVIGRSIWNNKSGVHNAGQVQIESDTIFIPLDSTKINNTGGVFYHEYGHAIDLTLASRGIINFTDDAEFKQLDTLQINTRPTGEYTDKHTTPYGASSTSEDRADIFRYAFSSYHPATKVEEGARSYYTWFNSEIVQKKVNTIFSRIESLKPNLGKYFARTAPFTPDSAPNLLGPEPVKGAGS